MEPVARKGAQPSLEELGRQIALDLGLHGSIGIPLIQPPIHGPICDEEGVDAAHQDQRASKKVKKIGPRERIHNRTVLHSVVNFYLVVLEEVMGLILSGPVRTSHNSLGSLLCECRILIGARASDWMVSRLLSPYNDMRDH